MIEGSFWIVLTGVLATASCGLLGTFLVLRKMSLLGDALSHAVLNAVWHASRHACFLSPGSRTHRVWQSWTPVNSAHTSTHVFFCVIGPNGRREMDLGQRLVCRASGVGDGGTAIERGRRGD